MSKRNSALATIETKTSKSKNISKVKVSRKKVLSSTGNKKKPTIKTQTTSSELKSKIKAKTQISSKIKLKIMPAKPKSSKSKTEKSENNSSSLSVKISKLTNGTSIKTEKTSSSPAVSDKAVDFNSKTPLDRSQINFPYDIRINGFSSLLSTVQKATPKVQQLLQGECDIILECRCCRNLFRSIPNFLSHKQTFCKATYHPSSEMGCSQLIQRPDSSNNIEYHIDTTSLQGHSVCTFKDNQETFTSDNKNYADEVVAVEDSETRSALSLYNDISKKTRNISECTSETLPGGKVNLVLEPVQNRNDLIVYQRKVVTDSSICDSSNTMHDSREVVDRDTAILGPDGKIICTGTARGIEKIVKHLTAQIDLTQRKMVQNGTNQWAEKCDICKTVFNTEKAFRKHRRDAPDCVKQSTSKVPIGSSTSGNLPSTVSSLSSNEEAYNIFDPNTPTAKRARLDESTQSSTSKFVKKLFASSPTKNIKEIQDSPIKSPMFAKKLLSSSSGKISPYKKTVGKAVKNLQNSSGLSISELHMNSESLPCPKCSARFQTTSEMSVHLTTRCTGGIVRKSLPVFGEKKRIGIEIRHSYSKGPSQNKQSCSPVYLQVPKEISDCVISKPVIVDKSFASEESLSSKTEEVVTLSNNNKLEPENILVSQDLDHVIERQSLKATHEKLNSDSLNSTNVSTQELLGDSEKSDKSEVDQDNISNVTDSGLSSSTAVSDGHLESSEDSPISPILTDVSLSNGESKKLRFLSKSKATNATTPADDRVLTPKNKNLKPYSTSCKRTSTRIFIKKDEVQDKLKLSRKTK